jgi:hypothetical protein
MNRPVVPKCLIAILTLVVSVCLSMFVLCTPKPVTEEQKFSSTRALTYIEEISREPHSVFDSDAHENVRLYIKDTLTGYLGADHVIEYNYKISDFITQTGEIRNILGVIPGKSETAIMLVGHYDSVLGSYGAADDGYALGTMLEIADLYKNQELENTIYFLFTDAEEMGLYGAAAIAANEKYLMSKVGFIINIEARGVSGAAYMFETSQNNKKVIDFYRQARFPVSYSLSTAIYQVMPNDTDFTMFREAGKNGLNFSVIEGIDHYHSPLDNYYELNSTSLQHYGEQIVPLVDAFVKDSKYSDVHYFDANLDSVFFTLFPNVFVSYSETAANILHIAVLILLIAVTFVMLRKRLAQFRKTIGSLLLFLGTFFLSVILSVGFAYLIAHIGNVPYYFAYVVVNGSEWAALLFMLVVAALVYAIYARVSDSLEKQRTFLFFGISLQLSLALITGFLLPGMSFLFFVPALLGTLALAASLQGNATFKHLAYGATTIFSILLIVPILYTFFLALTIGSTPILVAIMLIHLTVLIPVFRLHVNTWTHCDAA